MALHIYDRLFGISLLVVFVLTSLYTWLLVFLEVATFQISYSDINTSSKFRDKAFGKLWLRIRNITFNKEIDTELPGLVAKASGVVVELGPGSGNQLTRYDKSKVTKIYGIEPTTSLHPALREGIVAAGLSDVYTIVPCGVEDTEILIKYGLHPQSADTVLSVQCLCGVPGPQNIIKAMYALIKPGGKMIAYEHVRAVDRFTKLVQNVFMSVWPPLMGGCELTRPTGDWLLTAGKWESVDFHGPEAEEPWVAVPHAAGILVKAK